MTTDITLASLTEAKIGGTGVFDVLMEAAKAHLDAQFLQGRIKGTEYATVYLGQLQTVMQTALTFLTERQKVNLEAQLLEQQVILAQAQVQKAQAEVELMAQQVLNAKQEVLLSQQKVIQIQEEIKLLPKQGQKIDADIVLSQKQGLQVEAQTLNVPKQGLQIEAQTALINQQEINAEQEKLNLVAQECVLRAQFDNTQANTIKAGKETDLLAQKVTTEQAQTMGMGVDENSVLGRQKALYQAQTAGFQRDAEQKAAKIMIDSWNTRRMTDEGVVADSTNKLEDANIGRAVDKLLGGVGA